MTAINNNSLTATPSAASAAGNTSAIKDNYLDQNSLNSVKLMGRHNDPAALKEISKKFEAMFVQQMLKSMRDANAVFAEGDMFSSEEVKFHQEMLDQQMVLNLTSGEGIGLAKSMFQQMQKLYAKPADINSPSDTIKTLNETGVLKGSLTPVTRIKPITTSTIDTNSGKNVIAQTPEEFLEKVKPYAEKAAAELNVGTDVILAQAALEQAGANILFTIPKAITHLIFLILKLRGGREKCDRNTLENKQGITQQERSAFRQYDDYEQSFADYVTLIKTNPRYKEALTAGNDSEGYADALQKAGYATDPAYADKIKRLLNSDSIRSASDANPADTIGAES